ncbi:uncharacterized protein [Palaemon carinicauda]|uniref:uncharacterized protein n=1 Tax=Palaemon carinicauda TaxID=392227 RepID=UPI0035B68D10
MESLSTNVPVQETIQIIVNNVYRSDNVPFLFLKPDILESCAIEPLSFHTEENSCVVDGIAMVSPLGDLFAIMYMAAVDDRTFSHEKPKIYARYVDDIFITISRPDEPKKPFGSLKANSILNFATEAKRKILFLTLMTLLINNKSSVPDHSLRNLQMLAVASMHRESVQTHP